ncbi:rhodanese-like protein [Thiobacillus denitrificans ATCC 25259]|uniref:Rhodanese-like protein n=1 Tax=Thiobacillus denitrificans (strain ATCC 25259 / T1) TaxID=292415 RepID=Q3SMS9_THIDA|nr:rhodanese-like domain-containing protein [Thiobacillus denitrificans]AAZ95961.1 rhodanese-like protein [Thiobacillus denitrificans ATCC 25259]
MRFTLLPLVLVSALAQAEPLTLGVVLDQNESISDTQTNQRYRAFVRDVERAVGQPVRMQYYTRGFSAIKHAKDGTLDMVFGPAQVIANIGKFKFEPILKSGETAAAAFVAGPAYKGQLAARSGARLGVPDYESLMGGMARSEINSRGLSKRDFSEIKFHRMAEAPLYGLKLGRYDLAVASAEEAKAWTASNGGRIVFTTAAVPLRALSVQPERVDAGMRQKLAAGLTKNNSLQLALAGASKADFKSVASMLNTTPTVLPGAKVIGAAQTRELMAQGVPVYDVRVGEEYAVAHVPGAISVPYKEGSAKEVGFDAADDQFALNKLPKDKNAPFIMYCDGTICWKSYKSAVMAIQAGWKNVYWFRGGFPEWKEAGMPVIARKE